MNTIQKEKKAVNFRGCKFTAFLFYCTFRFARSVLFVLPNIQLDGLIISHEEYERLCDEVCELMTHGRLPMEICRLEMKTNGSLVSGYSWMFVAYGVGMLYRKNRLPRELWIEYLERKIAKPKGTLLKKFGMRPERWRELITRA